MKALKHRWRFKMHVSSYRKRLKNGMTFMLCFWFVNSWAFTWLEPQSINHKKVLLAGYHNKLKRHYHICRAMLWGTEHLGVTWPQSQQCHIPYDTNLYHVDNYTILQAKGYWQPYIGILPKQAKPLGQAVNHLGLYLCRGYWQGQLLPGVFFQKHRICRATDGSHVYDLSRFSLFILSSQFKERHINDSQSDMAD